MRNHRSTSTPSTDSRFDNTSRSNPVSSEIRTDPTITLTGEDFFGFCASCPLTTRASGNSRPVIERGRVEAGRDSAEAPLLLDGCTVLMAPSRLNFDRHQ